MTFRLGSVSIDPVELGSRGNAVLGIRDSGKTVTAKVLGEHLHDAGIPLVVFDPSGMWRFLRVPGKGKGRPVVVAGGKDGDLPLTPASAPKIVEAAMQAGLSLVLHLDLSLSKADWRAIVRDSVRLLMQRNAEFGLRHVILEEAAEFVPQVVRGDHAVVYGEVERMIRIGGNAGLGCTLVNQRAEEVNKAVLELCDNLFLHRQKGRNSLTALTKWLDIGAVKEGKAIIDTLATLPSGECWAWLHGSERPVHIKVPMCDSFHPNRRDLRAGGTVAKLKPVPMEDFVEKLKTQLPAIEEQRKANDPAELRKEIAELKRQLGKAASRELPVVHDTKALAAEYERGLHEGLVDGFASGYNAAQNDACKAIMALDMAPRLGAMPLPKQKASAPAHRPVSARAAPVSRAPVAPRVNGYVQVDGISRPQQRILDALAWLEMVGLRAADKVRVAMLAGQSSKSSGYRANLSTLSGKGLIAYVGDGDIGLTDDGRAAANHPDQPPSSEELQAAIRGKISGPQWRMLEALIPAYPEALQKDDLAAKSDQSPLSSGFRANLSTLSGFGFIKYQRDGSIAAQPILFVE